MPTYTVKDPQTGKTVKLTGDSPPTEAELTEIFASVKPSTTPTTPATSPAPAPTGLKASIRERMLTNLGVPPNADLASILKAGEAKDRERTSAGVSAMPSVGGLIGGMAGGIPGAAVGGIVGEAVREVADPSQRPATIGQQAVAIGKEGGKQAVFQGAGQGMAWAGGKLAKWLMNRATTRVTAKLAQDFPELSDTLIDKALTVSQGGYGKAQGLLKMAKVKATAALTAADAKGVSLPVELTPELADSLKTALIEHAVKSGKLPVPSNAPLSVATERLPVAMKATLAQIDNAANGGTFTLTAKQADLFKTQLQRESRALYFNRIAPNGPKAMAAEATVKAEFASRLNDAIDALASGYKAANAEAQPLIGAVRGIKQAIRPSGNLYQAMVRPGVGAIIGGTAGQRQGHPIAGAVAGAALTAPANMSRLAISLGNPVIQELLRQLPRGLAAAIESQLGSAPAPATEGPQ